jgi:CRISPR-associated protein Cmr1
MNSTITATFRVVTPMFLGGAYPTAEAEVRLPSIKGALRFWWRAMMWGRITNVDELRRQEADLFGSCDTGQSRFLMQMSPALVETNTVNESWPPASWQRYSGYGLQDKGERRFIRAGSEWTVSFNPRRCTPEQTSQITAAIQLFGLVGGLGSRSRKGWGSITLVRMEGASWQYPVSGDAWNQAVQCLLPASRANTATYTAFTTAARWNFGQSFQSAISAQQWLAKKYQERVKSTDPKGDRAQFGLPRQFKRPTPPRNERRSSPLFLHIHQCPNGHALPTAMWLPSSFLENNAAIPGSGTSGRQFVETLHS